MKHFCLILTLIGLGIFDTGNAQADLAPDEREFITEFLGLSRKEANRKFQEAGISTSNASQRYGEIKSDQLNILYLNYDEFHRHDDGGLRLKGTRVHEAIHAYLKSRNQKEELWIEEGIALLGEYLYDIKTFGKEKTLLSFLPLVNEYLQSPDRSFNAFDNRAADYGKSLLFFLYLYETFHGDDFIQAYFQGNHTGWEALIDASITALSFQLTPRSWKNPEVLIPQFYWSLFQKRNTLSTKNTDRFSQLIQNYEKKVPIQEWKPQSNIASQGFTVMSLPPDNIGYQIQHASKVLVYLVSPDKDRFTAQPLSELLSQPQNTSSLLLIINLEPQSESISFIQK